jgi:effector-binding domain-containing protein
MSYTCQFQNQPAQPVISVRLRTSVEHLPEQLGLWFGSLARHITALGEEPAGAPFVAYFNMDMQDLDIEIGFPVAKELPGEDQIQPGHIPAGPVVSCLNIGPYDKMDAAYQAMAQRIEATGTVYEFYFNAPDEVPAEELQTRIVMPLMVDD